MAEHDQRHDCRERMNAHGERIHTVERMQQRIFGASVVMSLILASMLYGWFSAFGEDREALVREGATRSALARIEERIATLAEDIKELKAENRGDR